MSGGCEGGVGMSGSNRQRQYRGITLRIAGAVPLPGVTLEPGRAYRQRLRRIVHTSLFDLFKIGIGPSSSSRDPVRAAYHFAERLSQSGALESVARVHVDLYGSLALTGKGHGTDRGIQLGLLGERPDTVDPAAVDSRLAEVAERSELALFGRRPVPFHPAEDIAFRVTETLPAHPNGMRFTAFGENGEIVDRRIYYSIGGGFGP